jgi:hypothetical protein
MHIRMQFCDNYLKGKISENAVMRWWPSSCQKWLWENDTWTHIIIPASYLEDPRWIWWDSIFKYATAGSFTSLFPFETILSSNTFRLFYLQAKSPKCLLNRKLGGPVAVKRQISAPAANQILADQLVASHLLTQLSLLCWESVIK